MSDVPTDGSVQQKPWPEARLEVLEKVLGKSEGWNAPYANEIPDQVSDDLNVEISLFRGHIPGVVAATMHLIGHELQIENDQGTYELILCSRPDERSGEDLIFEWGPNLIRQLALYTFEESIEPGDTMDIVEVVPEGSSIAGLLFVDYVRFEINQEEAGLLLCIGITQDEVEACQNGEVERVFEALKTKGVYPYTDLYRPSVLLD